MKKIILLAILFLVLQLKNANTQVVSPELLGEWSFEFELDLCRQTIISGCDMDGLTISQFNDNVDLDTLMITEYKEPDEYFPARYEMSVINGEPNDQYVFSNLDSTTAMNPFLFLSTYYSDSIIFNWTTTDPGLVKRFELISSDTLVFHWTSSCNACHCGTDIYFSRIGATNSISLESNFEEWRFYPNPAKEYIWLEKTESDKNTLTRVSVIDSKGVVLKEIKTYDHLYNLSLEGFNSGLFYLKIETENKIDMKKFIILN